MANGGFGLKLGTVCAAALAVGGLSGASSATPASPAATRSIIPVGTQGTNGPSTVTAAGSTGYVTIAPLSNFALPGYLAWVDLRRKRQLARVKVGPNPEGFALDTTTGLGYVSNLVNHGTVHVVDLKRRKVVRTLSAGQNPWTLAVVRSGGRRLLVVLNNGRTQPARGSIDIWNLSTFKRIRRIGVNFSPLGLASIGGDRMLVGAFSDGPARVLDLNKLKLVQSVRIPAGPVNGLAAGTKHIYVTGLNGISVLDRRTLKPVGRVIKPLPPEDPLGVTVSGDTAYVVNNGAPGNGSPFPNGTLQILLGTRTLGSRKVGKDAQDVALTNGGRNLLVNARLDATVWLIPRP